MDVFIFILQFLFIAYVLGMLYQFGKMFWLLFVIATYDSDYHRRLEGNRNSRRKKVVAIEEKVDWRKEGF